MELTKLNKTFIMFNVLTIFTSDIDDKYYKQRAKLWFKRFRNTGNTLWKELNVSTQKVSEDTNMAFDELGAYMFDVVNVAMDIPIDKYNDFLDLIHNFKNNCINDTNSSIKEIN